MVKYFLFMVVLVLAFTVLAPATNSGEIGRFGDKGLISCGPEFQKFDVTADGYLTWGEYKSAYDPGLSASTGGETHSAKAYADFIDKDVNRDDLLSVQEFCS